MKSKIFIIKCVFSSSKESTEKIISVFLWWTQRYRCASNCNLISGPVNIRRTSLPSSEQGEKKELEEMTETHTQSTMGESDSEDLHF